MRLVHSNGNKVAQNQAGVSLLAKSEKKKRRGSNAVNCVHGARVCCGNKTEDQGQCREAAASGANIRLNNICNK